MKYLSLGLPGGQNIEPPSGVPHGGIDKVSLVFKNGLTIMLILCVILALIFLVLGGIQWITSGGDKSKLQAARAKLIWAIVGLIVGFGAFFIVSLLGYIFKVNLLGFGS